MNISKNKVIIICIYISDSCEFSITILIFNLGMTDDDYNNEDVVVSQSLKSCKTSSHKFLKTPIPHELFYDFIKKIACKMPNSNYYLIDLTAYKKATYCEEYQLQSPHHPGCSLLEQFCNDLIPYYCKEKQFFLTRKMSYNNLNTILRQVCRHCAIEFKTDRKYDKSKTQIVYYIACDTTTSGSSGSGSISGLN